MYFRYVLCIASESNIFTVKDRISLENFLSIHDPDLNFKQRGAVDGSI